MRTVPIVEERLHDARRKVCLIRAVISNLDLMGEAGLNQGDALDVAEALADDVVRHLVCLQTVRAITDVEAPDDERLERGGTRLTRWLPPLDTSQFEGSQTEMNRFNEQRFARQARDAFAEFGRGVLIVHIDHRAATLRGEYNTLQTDDDSETARAVRAMVERYDPSRQAVIVYRDLANLRDVKGIVDIEPTH